MIAREAREYVAMALAHFETSSEPYKIEDTAVVITEADARKKTKDELVEHLLAKCQ